MMRELRRYPNAQLMWVQEEPLNMGAFSHVSHRIETCMRHEVNIGSYTLLRCSFEMFRVPEIVSCSSPHWQSESRAAFAHVPYRIETCMGHVSE